MEVFEWVDVVDLVSNIIVLFVNFIVNGLVLDMNGMGLDFNLMKLLNENGNGIDLIGLK